MKRVSWMVIVAVLFVFLAVPSTSTAADLSKKMADVLSQAPRAGFWQISPDDVLGMIKAKKTDFVIVDVRPNPAEYAKGHIPGAIQISVQNILQPASLKKLPKGKKIILICVTGQTQNLPIIPLRAMGYNAYTMKFGMSSWIKGYHGARIMQGAISGAGKKNYPLVK